MLLFDCQFQSHYIDQLSLFSPFLFSSILAFFFVHFCIFHSARSFSSHFLTHTSDCVNQPLPSVHSNISAHMLRPPDTPSHRTAPSSPVVTQDTTGRQYCASPTRPSDRSTWRTIVSHIHCQSRINLSLSQSSLTHALWADQHQIIHATDC